MNISIDIVTAVAFTVSAVAIPISAFWRMSIRIARMEQDIKNIYYLVADVRKELKQ